MTFETSNDWTPYEPINDQLTGRIALVTGGSRGIGRAICLALAMKGAFVAVHYRAQSTQAEVVVQHIKDKGGRAISFQADLAVTETANDLVAAVRNSFGGLHILINNAGEMTDAAVDSMTDATWDNTINTNLSAVFRLSRAAIPLMSIRGWGRIINLTSQAAYTGSANHAHYAAAKAGLSGLTYSLAKELASRSITVNLVAPGRIATDMLTARMTDRVEEWQRQTPLKRLGDPREVAAAVAFLASDGASYITGATVHVNGGMLMA